MKIAKVFPRKTNASPNDKNSFFDIPGMFDNNFDKINISVTFTYDINRAEWLAKQWEHIAPVEIGGPAFGNPSGEFIPGKYLKKGYTITSRGCPNKCWFCSVHKREPKLKELKIKDGWNILDDNILACSEKHVKDVFKMLKKQNHRAHFTGGLEAKILKEWHVNLLVDLNPKEMFFAYDTKDDYEPLLNVSKIFKKANLFKGHNSRCYVLIGYPKDTIEKARIRLVNTIKLGFFPMAMLWKNKNGDTTIEWKRFQRKWANPFIVGTKIKKYCSSA